MNPLQNDSFLIFSTITPIVGKKRKRNPSSDNSDAEVLPSQASPVEDEDSVQVLFNFFFPPYLEGLQARISVNLEGFSIRNHKVCFVLFCTLYIGKSYCFIFL